VLLSTHIVEDVAVLCPRFAVIRGGRLVALTTPAEARGALAGQIFEGGVDARDLDDLARRHRVIQAILVEGRHRARLHAPERSAPEGFEPVAPTLEDAYLVFMRTEVERDRASEPSAGAPSITPERTEAAPLTVATT
jgi:ABC-type multidrug transport system ATPase subunit